MLHFQVVISPRPILARLIAITIAVVAAGAGGMAARAPQALRVWVDSAAEVTAAARTAAAPAQAARQLVPAPGHVRLRLARQDGQAAPLDDSAPATAGGPSGSPGWPTAGSGRDVVTRKRSLLI